MAKSARASIIKKNKSALRNRVFSPVERARNERLSAKLLKLASQPKPPRAEMDVEGAETKDDAATTTAASTNNAVTAAAEGTTDMDIDAGSGDSGAAAGKTQKSKREVARIRAGRVARAASKRKPQNQRTFATPGKKRTGGAKKR